MTEKWYEKSYVCTGCDMFLDMITKSETLRDLNCLECQAALVLISIGEHKNANISTL